ncbi:MAG: hypothetical protein QXR09_01155 [Candidatus Aenigmatarchaeota archaeon]
MSIYLSTFFISNQYLEIKKRFLSCGFLHEIAENKFGLTHHYEPDYKYKCLMYPYSKVEELVEYLWSINPSNLRIENFLCEKCRKVLEICRHYLT